MSIIYYKMKCLNVFFCCCLLQVSIKHLFQWGWLGHMKLKNKNRILNQLTSCWGDWDSGLPRGLCWKWHHWAWAWKPHISNRKLVPLFERCGRLPSRESLNKGCYRIALWEVREPVFWELDPYYGTKSGDISASAAPILAILFFCIRHCKSHKSTKAQH